MKLTSHIRRLNPVACACLVFLLAFLAAFFSTSGGPSRPLKTLLQSTVRQGALHFAIADFDGDLQPDVAVVRVSRDGAPSSQYFIDLKFSSGPRSGIELIAPSGGLEISPEDVNGDHLTDLVLTSTIDSHFVAIYLNDGEGRFHVVDASAYPAVGKRNQSSLNNPAPVSGGVFFYPSRSSDYAAPDETSCSHGLARGALLSRFQTPWIPAAVAFDSVGRAPPFPA